MKNNRWILGLVVLVIAIAALSFFGFKKNSNGAKPSKTNQVNNTSTEQPNYFDENAPVMFFYSDYCSWCLKQKEVLQKLGTEGYRVKPMNVGAKPELWKDFSIQGTPTMIAKNGDRLEGYKDYDQLKAWLDQHK